MFVSLVCVKKEVHTLVAVPFALAPPGSPESHGVHKHGPAVGREEVKGVERPFRFVPSFEFELGGLKKGQ